MTSFSERHIRWILAGVGLGAFVLLLTLEIVTEEDEVSLPDLLVDAAGILLTVAAAVGIILLIQRMGVQHEERMSLIRDLEIARAEGEGWQARVQSHLLEIKPELDKRFHEWGMTDAEQEIGLLMLKGFSHKEIAALRATTEATVRQQAQSICRKSNSPDKTAFFAYFLEDLFAPDLMASDSTAHPSED